MRPFLARMRSFVVFFVTSCPRAGAAPGKVGALDIVRGVLHLESVVQGRLTICTVACVFLRGVVPVPPLGLTMPCEPERTTGPTTPKFC